jgi:hypothetical protein
MQRRGFLGRLAAAIAVAPAAAKVLPVVATLPAAPSALTGLVNVTPELLGPSDFHVGSILSEVYSKPLYMAAHERMFRSFDPEGS